ncbi:MAG TPA: DUF72 domain-containing protein [Micropepsaceae bacterium]|nr:DUF72 domain-containing protein [Micropepsaceae bacterium]
MTRSQGNVRIGISGWHYRGWRGRFYPPGLRQKDELAYAASKFSSVEINGTFYRMQTPDSFGVWTDVTPDPFVFAIKGPRFITHMLKLTRAKTPLANFFASGVLRLGKKLGPILWQLPPNLGFNSDRLEEFLALLPYTTGAARKLARGHDAKLKSKAWLKFDGNREIRHALEIRHESFKTVEFIRLLRKFNIALVCADSVDWPLLTDLTADFAYCRLHGSETLYASGYDNRALRIWSRRVTRWAKGDVVAERDTLIDKPVADARRRDVYVYFDNDAKVRAPVDAMALRAKIERARALEHPARVS